MGVYIDGGEERFTGFTSVIQSDHNYIHAGKAYNMPLFIDDLASAGVSYIRLTTPDNLTSYTHFRPIGFSTVASGVLLEFFEEPTLTTQGTTKTPVNRNRNSSKSANTTIGTGATVSADGTLVLSATVGSGGNQAKTGGGSADGSTEEIVLKPSTDYVIKVTNIGAVTTDIYISVFWYEEGQGV